MKTGKNLKHCPFCKGKAMTMTPYAESFYVMCKKCCARTDNYKTEQEARNAWNKRPLSPYEQHAEELFDGIEFLYSIAENVCEAVSPLYKTQSLSPDNLTDEMKKLSARLDEIRNQVCSFYE